MLFDQHISPLCSNPLFQSEEWRRVRYFVEENDMLIKKYRPIFTELYKKNSKLKVKPGNKAFMCLGEFKSLFERIGIAGNEIQERDINISFNCSMMTQIDELENERFIRMSEIEFIEAVGRCSSILPDQCRVENVFEKETPMYGKFEWIIHELKMLCSEDVKSQFSPTESLFRKEEDD